MRSQDGKILFACHSRTNFLPGYFFFLQVRQMFFTDDGWPVLNQNEYYADKNFSEKLESLKTSDIVGNYDAILTVRGSSISDYKPFGQNDPVSVVTADGVPTVSKQISLSADGKVSGAYNGNWELASDGYTFTVSLDGLGKFRGYVLNAVDWAKRKGKNRKTITFTCFDGEKSGEYFWGNKKEK